MARVANKIALITGAAGGIGAASARLLAQEGATVVLTDIDEAGGKALADEIVAGGGRAQFHAHDVTSEEDWIHVTDDVRREHGAIDILLNNAGVYVIEALPDLTVETWNRVMAINVTGTFLGMKHTAPAMAAHGGGSIINLSSLAAFVGTAGHALYGATKGAVRAMTKDVAAEFAAGNVRVNSLHPGYVNTPMAAYGADVAGLPLEELGPKLSPLGRIAEPLDVASFVLFLASDEASYLTGGEYLIDGGSSTTLSV